MNDMLAQLKDIKPPVEVPDHTWLILFALAVLAALILLLLYRFLGATAGRRRRRRRRDPREVAREKIASIDFNRVKEAVYTFDEYMPVLIEEASERETFEHLRKELEKYKYRKTVPPLDAYDERRMRSLIKKVMKHG
ncbi:hypothetical protein [Hydrogenimonas urashimensis]|uniref:hypothetical protein n=1 Tax=Hydrogenimonas urashimensis TaxID=2740515 RepID=UPI001915EBF9|nr:hypothetical protein [Hydrogenimonas urashimensis]